MGEGGRREDSDPGGPALVWREAGGQTAAHHRRHVPNLQEKEGEGLERRRRPRGPGRTDSWDTGQRVETHSSSSSFPIKPSGGLHSDKTMWLAKT